jgi:hypothetical protein
VKAELNLRHIARIARILTPPAALASWGPPRLGLSVDGDQVTVATTNRDLTAQAHTRGGMADGHTSVAAADLSAALTAVAPTGRAAGKAVVRLHTEPGQLHLTATTAAVIPTTDPGPAPTLPDGAAPVLTVPIRTWLDTLAAAVIAADPAAGPRQGTDALRLWRDPGCCLVVDATDTYRVHRGVLGEPEPDRHESWLPAVTARAGMRMLVLAHEYRRRGVMDPKKIANLYYDAWMHRAGDMSDVPLAADVTFRGPVASFNDAAGYRQRAAQAGAAVRSFRVRHQFADGDLVCSVVDWEMAPVDGVLTAAEILEIRGGQIVRGELIYDAEQLRKAMSQGA